MERLVWDAVHALKEGRLDDKAARTRRNRSNFGRHTAADMRSFPHLSSSSLQEEGVK